MPLDPPVAVVQPRVVDSRVMALLRRHYNALFVLEQPTDVTDGQGGTTRTWSGELGQPAGISVAGALEPLTADEALKEGGIEGTNYHYIFVDYRSEPVTQLWRVRYGTRLFDVRGVTNLGNLQLVTQLFVSERIQT